MDRDRLREGVSPSVQSQGLAKAVSGNKEVNTVFPCENQTF